VSAIETSEVPSEVSPGTAPELNGKLNGKPNGALNGTVNGKPNGTVNGNLNGTVNGTPNGNLNATVDAKADASLEGGAEGGLEGGSGLPKNLGRNVFVNYIAVVAISITAIVTTPILLHHLGLAAMGVYSLAGSVVAYLQLFDMGFGAATIRQVAADANRRPAGVIRTVNTNFFALGILGSVALVVGLAVAFVSPSLFKVHGALANDTVITFAILAVALAISIPFDTLGGVLAAYQRFDWLSICNVSVTVLAAGGGCVAVVLGFGLVGAAVASAAAALGLHFVRWWLVRKLVPGVRLAPRLIDRTRLRGSARESGWFLLRDITDVVINQADLVVVGLLLGIKPAAVYAIGLKLAQISRRAMKPLSQVFFPEASTLANNNQGHRLSLLLMDGTRISLAVALPIALVLTIMAKPLLSAWGVSGDLRDYLGQAIAVLVLLAGARGLTAITETAWWLLAGAGWIRVTAMVALVESVVNLGSSVALAKPLGPAGVALGTFIGLTCVGLPCSLVLASRLTGIRLRTFLLRSVVPQILPAVVVGVGLLLLVRVVPQERFLTLTMACLGFFAYLAIYLVVTPAPEERARGRQLVKLLVGRKLPRGRHIRATSAD
jgi:O-antigen/teichoic acid export membrane protein